MIVALSAPYLSALRIDLEFLAQTLGPRRLWLVAVGVDAKKLAPELGSCFVPLTSRVERLVSSPRATLNLRALAWWLEEVVPVGEWDRAEQNHEIQRRFRALEPREARVKRSLSDAEVTRWLEQQRSEAGSEWPRGGKTGLLRTLRMSGLACEQNRFSRLYAEVAARP